MIEWALNDALKKAAKIAIEEAVMSHKDKMQKELIRQLSVKNSPLIKSMVQSIAAGVFSETNLKYRLTVNVEQ